MEGLELIRISLTSYEDYNLYYRYATNSTEKKSTIVAFVSKTCYYASVKLQSDRVLLVVPVICHGKIWRILINRVGFGLVGLTLQLDRELIEKRSGSRRRDAKCSAAEVTYSWYDEL
jgi:hypothetical protein